MRIVFNGKCTSVRIDSDKNPNDVRYSSAIEFKATSEAWATVQILNIKQKLNLGQIIQIIVTDETETELATKVGPKIEAKTNEFANKIHPLHPTDYPIVGAAASGTIAESYPNKLDRYPSKV